MGYRPAVRCAWCGRDLDQEAERLGSRTRCSACGAATTDPWPDDAELERAYGDWYRPSSGRFGRFGDALLRRTRGQLAGRIDRVAPPGPVLDVGAGDGSLLAALSAKGREALGLERDAARGDMVDKELAAVEGSWAAIVFWHSLEHLSEPGNEVTHAASLLEPGGLMVVSIPNEASLQARIFGDSWLALDLPRHLVHLPLATLLAGIEERGLRVTRISHVRGGQVAFGWLHGLVGSLPGRPNLYDAIRSPRARSKPLSAPMRVYALIAAVALLPFAVAGTLAEVISRRSGTVYLEARK